MAETEMASKNPMHEKNIDTIEATAEVAQGASERERSGLKLRRDQGFEEDHGGFAGRHSGYRGASTRGVILGASQVGYLNQRQFQVGDRFWAPLTELSRSPWSH